MNQSSSSRFSKIMFWTMPWMALLGITTGASDIDHTVGELLPQQDSSSWWFPVALENDEDLHGTDADNKRRRHLVEINECADTADWFNTRNTDGVNLFKEFFNCSCSGDLGSYYTYACRLEDYCFDLDLVPTVQEQLCVDINLTFDFSVNETSGVIQTVERADRSLDYLNQGPTQRLYFIDPAACALHMQNIHFYTTPESIELCTNTTMCPQVLINDLGYTQERMLELCPLVTLGGIECAGFGLRSCGAGGTETTFFSSTHDCSNVEPCATSSCQEFFRVLPTPGRNVAAYPECPEFTDSPTSSPTMEPSMVTLTQAPTANSEPPTSSPTMEPSMVTLTQQAPATTSEPPTSSPTMEPSMVTLTQQAPATTSEPPTSSPTSTTSDCSNNKNVWYNYYYWLPCLIFL